MFVFRRSWIAEQFSLPGGKFVTKPVAWSSPLPHCRADAERLCSRSRPSNTPAMRLPPLLAFASVLLGFATPATADIKWYDITAEDRAATRSEIDPDAGAEILYHRIRLNCGSGIRQNYFRIKLYDEKAAPQLAAIAIEPGYLGHGGRIYDVAARVTTPDGQTAILPDNAFLRQDYLLDGSRSSQRVAFAIPRLSPGTIIEYQWTTSSPFQWHYFFALPLDGKWPTRHVAFKVAPTAGLKSEVSFLRCRPSRTPEDAAGYSLFEAHDIPARQSEPFPPPDREIGPWILFSAYPIWFKPEKKDLWQYYGQKMAEHLAVELTVNDAIRACSAGLVNPGGDDRDKLGRIYRFCQTRIRNLARNPAGGSTDAGSVLLERHDTADILRVGCGYPRDINLLFLALVRAAGFEARWALCGDRREVFFRQKVHDLTSLDGTIVGIHLGERWIFCNPGNPHLPFGELGWGNEGIQALALDVQNSEWLPTPNRVAADSCVRQTANLHLETDGTLEGEVRLELTGHRGIAARDELTDLSAGKRTDLLRKRLQQRLPDAELSALEVLNAEDPAAPFQINYHVRVPGYAERTGLRLVLQPAFFEKSVPALFTAEQRTLDIYLRYPWSEEDDVAIALPEGWTFEHPSSPESFGAEEGSPIQYKVSLGVTPSGASLHYKRFFACELQFVNKDQYSIIKSTFDEIQRRDAHTVILQRTETPTTVPQPAPAP